ncbi:MAG: hypothetical protein K0S78_2007 [Thermomicrobiales bacterium]|jgi:hypothetical protein|nr:hypothetical protein [Thermomicrobiales bacterium]MDF3041162.1 hypothetical protein [Thermomicrobiales bacterium]
MDAHRFDTLTRSLTGSSSRRILLRAIVGAPLGLVLAQRPDMARAKRRKKPKFNEYGCLEVGQPCAGKDARCCSGICRGKKGKRGTATCVGHDTGGCRAGQLDCGGISVPCTTSTGNAGGCYTTTGNAGYCASDGDCFPCNKDADCRPFCGPRAACMRCETGCSGIGTLCLGPGGCIFP